MTGRKTVVLMPRVNANDDSGIVATWLTAAGEPVRRGEIIAQIETTKAAVDIEAEGDGFLHPLVAAGTTVAVGLPLAWIVPSYDPKLLAAEKTETAAAAQSVERLISDRARALMLSAGLELRDIPGAGPVSEKDVRAALGSRSVGHGTDLTAAKALPVVENSLMLFGAASQGDVVIDCLRERGEFTPLCFVDDRPSRPTYAGLPVFSSAVLQDLRRANVRYAHVCVGDAKVKLRIAAMLKEAGFVVANVIHPRATVSPTARLGEGVFVGPGVVIGPEAVIGDYCQINNNATVPHHVRLGVAVRIADGANLGGGITVGDRSYIGLGVTINTDCNIGADVTLVSGVSVFDSVPDGAIVRPPKIRH